ncbi:hypothetical protein ACRCQU_19645, partial [Pseudomonas aeruginosa]
WWQQGQVIGVFGDCQFTCFPDCQLALPQYSAKNLKKGHLRVAFVLPCHVGLELGRRRDEGENSAFCGPVSLTSCECSSAA